MHCIPNYALIFLNQYCKFYLKIPSFSNNFIFSSPHHPVDRPGLKNRKLIREVQLDLLKALQLEISDNHPDDDQLFARLLTTIPKLREISPEHTRRLMDLKIRQPGVSFPPLHAEIFDLDKEEAAGESS